VSKETCIQNISWLYKSMGCEEGICSEYRTIPYNSRGQDVESMEFPY
jgi:hypothetical protein